MKLDIETTSVVNEKDQLEFVIQQQIKKFQTLLSSERKVPGHILFQYNVKTKELSRAKYDKVDVHFNWDSSKIGGNTKVTLVADCIYVQALNEKNAWKRIKRLEETK